MQSGSPTKDSMESIHVWVSNTRRFGVELREKGLPRGLHGKEPACRCRRHRFSPWVREMRAWHPTPVFLPGESHGQRSLAGYSAGGCKELDTTEHTQKRENEEEACEHVCVCALGRGR